MRLLKTCLKLGMGRAEAIKMLCAMSFANNADFDRSMSFMAGMKQGQRLERARLLKLWEVRKRENE